ncbi:lasso peptide biosynthesis B2 protein [Tsuneonella deserti]|uniref:lasso peptide biosynthesis B2 protein n=1 Tax=Tsuneonella deserti TaxID=2035528 RepID=UPI00166E1E4B|nr:lasso peptide biosynthesis B2 protein [Tsuneonella deserti]
MGERLVFLDVAADCYFCLDAEAEAEFRRLDRCPGSGAPSASLQDTGLFACSAHAAPPAPCKQPVPASRSLLDTPFPLAGPAATIAAIARLHEAKLRFRLQGLAGALASLRKAKLRSPARSGSRDDLAGAMASFVRAERIVTVADACLSHSYAVARQLLAQGLDASLVLGVRLGPFAAHCWVQHDDWVINDRLDTVRTFKPILVV